jgi:type II secretory pathway component PulF
MSTTEPTAPTRGFGLAVVGTVIPTVLVFSLFALYTAYVPPAKRTFHEFGMQLPLATQAVIRFSNWIGEYWWATVPFLALAGAGNFALLWQLAPRSRLLAVLWIAGSTLLLVAVLAITIVAIERPLAKLQEALAN